jgi:hypothetical protein
VCCRFAHPDDRERLAVAIVLALLAWDTDPGIVLLESG